MKLFCITTDCKLEKSTSFALTICRCYETQVSPTAFADDNYVYKFHNSAKSFDEYYHIIDDNNRYGYYPISCFITLEEYRNNKLTEILA